MLTVLAHSLFSNSNVTDFTSPVDSGSRDQWTGADGTPFVLGSVRLPHLKGKRQSASQGCDGRLLLAEERLGQLIV